MSWIKEINYEDATGQLKKIYNRVKGPNNNVDNILTAHSLRPHSLLGHMTLYKNVLHNSNNTIPKWFLETLGVYVSFLNECDYCVMHHFEGLKRLLNDDVFSKKIKKGIEENNFEGIFEEQYFLCLKYAELLTKSPNQLQSSDIQALRDAGLDDGEILEVNQVVSYFNYANRTVLGLGVDTEGDILGLSPNDSDDASNWGHS